MIAGASILGNRRQGFTLLELVLALLLIGLLVGLVFATARAALLLGNTVIRTQNEEMLKQAFFELLDKRFSNLPGNAQLNITVTESSAHYLSDLTLENAPTSFSWGGEERTAKAIQLSTIKRRSGYLDIVLRYFENEIIDPNSGSETGPGFSSSAIPEEPFAEITLLTDIRLFEWQLLNPRTMEYQYDWEQPGQLPLQLELICAFGAEGDPIRQVFWIPPKQNPEILMRQLTQGLNQPGAGTNQPGAGTNLPGAGEGNPELIIDTPQPTQ